MMMMAAAAQASTDPMHDVDEDSTVDRADARLLDHRMRSMNMIPAGNSLGSAAPFVLQTNHLDYIHDLVFDTYGRRMASCSGDRFVKIWDMRGVVAGATAASTAAAGGAHDAQQQSQQQSQVQQQSQQQSQAVRDAWVCSAAWQAHRGSVTCLSWCHPEYGTLLATSGLDQEVKIWEERSTAGLLAGGNNGAGVSSPAAAVGANNNSNGNSSSLWTLRASLTEAKRAVTCVAFAPRHCGLKVASASCDGSVRIYEAIDVVNVGSWPLAATLQAYGSNEKDEDDDEDDGGGNRQRGHRHGNAAADPRASSSSASSSSYSPSSHWLTLSWCTGRFDPPTLVVGGGTHPTESAISMAATTTTTSADKPSSLSSAGTVNAILIYRYMDTARAWLPMRILPRIAPGPTSTGNPSTVLASSPALCVAWAPNVGRRYHYVAAAYGDGLVVYKLKRGGIGTGTAGAAAAPTSGSTPTAHTTADLELESAQVLPVASAWRCQWNVTGTVLACSGDSGCVHMYKVSPHSGNFDLVSEIRHNINNSIADGNESSSGQD
jgi:nucleoporin SEH1